MSALRRAVGGAGVTCPRCDRADCDAVTGRAGPPEVIVVERRCDGEPVDWRARALEAEAEVAWLRKALEATAEGECRDGGCEACKAREALTAAKGGAGPAATQGEAGPWEAQQ